MAEASNGDIISAIDSMRKDMCDHFADLEKRISAHDGALQTITDQVSVLTAAKTSSIRARAELSDADLAQQSRLANEIAERQKLAKKVDGLDTKQDTQLAILTRLDKITSNPNVKIILAVLATAALSWAASKGVVVK